MIAKQFGHQRETELYFMQSRFYDPEIGRFLQPDSIVPDPMNSQSLNRYSYVLNNPLAYTDPTGHFVEGYAEAAMGHGWGWNFSSGKPIWDDEIYGHIVPPPMPSVGDADLDNWISAYGNGSFPDSTVLISVGEAAISAAPGTGDVLDACMYFTHRDCWTGESVPEWQRDLALVSLFSAVGFARYADEAAGAARFLEAGPANTHVYFGIRNDTRVYVGITDDLVERQWSHSGRFKIQPITTAPVTRDEARAIEEALIVENPGFENIHHSISPSAPGYLGAVDWGRAWLREHGY